MFYNPPGFTPTSSFGALRAIDGYKPHGGMDLGAPAGTSVPAALGGTVFRVGEATKYGYIVIIRDASGNFQLYAHLSKDGLPAVNDTIVAGESIGQVASKAENIDNGAGAINPHLHFEVISGSAPLQPTGGVGIFSSDLRYRADPSQYDPNNPVFPNLNGGIPSSLAVRSPRSTSKSPDAATLNAFDINSSDWQFLLDDGSQTIYFNSATGQQVAISSEAIGTGSNTVRITYDLFDANGTYLGSRVVTGNLDSASGVLTPSRTEYYDHNGNFIETKKQSSLNGDPFQFAETDPSGQTIEISYSDDGDTVTIGGVQISLEGGDAGLAANGDGTFSLSGSTTVTFDASETVPGLNTLSLTGLEAIALNGDGSFQFTGEGFIGGWLPGQDPTFAAIDPAQSPVNPEIFDLGTDPIAFLPNLDEVGNRGLLGTGAGWAATMSVPYVENNGGNFAGPSSMVAGGIRPGNGNESSMNETIDAIKSIAAMGPQAISSNPELFGQFVVLLALLKYQYDNIAYTDPLVLDSAGDGVLLDPPAAGPLFDVAGNGTLARVAWPGSSDGLIVRDVNGDGKISSGQELFSVLGNGQPALSSQDSNGDGVLDTNDANWSQLQIWNDRNRDGYASPEELQSLADAGIASINLTPITGTAAGQSNVKGVVATLVGGSHRTLWDVALDQAPLPAMTRTSYSAGIDKATAASFCSALSLSWIQKR